MIREVPEKLPLKFYVVQIFILWGYLSLQILDVKVGTNQKQWDNMMGVLSAVRMYIMMDHKRRKCTAG